MKHLKNNKLKAVKINTVSLTEVLSDYTLSPLQPTRINAPAFQALEFEKKVCRTSFKKCFGQYLPNPAVLEMSVGLLNKHPTLNSSRWRKIRSSNKITDVSKLVSDSNQAENNVVNGEKTMYSSKTFGLNDLTFNPCFRASQEKSKTLDSASLDINNVIKNNASKVYTIRSSILGRQKSLVGSGVQLMCSDWVLQRLIETIENRRPVRAVIGEVVRDGKMLINRMTGCSILGLRITASGRLTKRKKGIAQTYTVSTGKVPLGRFDQKVDYAQGFAETRSGHIGLKVWIAFES